MLNGDEFIDFIMSGEFDTLSSETEKKQYLCFHCGVLVSGYQSVKWISKSKGIFVCPNCGEEMQI